LVVQNAFGLLSPELPLQSPVLPGHCLIFVAKTVLANKGAIAIAAVAAIMTAAITSVLVFMVAYTVQSAISVLYSKFS
jgi:hypothetical protein